jgi:hypothetical protein
VGAARHSHLGQGRLSQPYRLRKFWRGLPFLGERLLITAMAARRDPRHLGIGAVLGPTLAHGEVLRPAFLVGDKVDDIHGI